MTDSKSSSSTAGSATIHPVSARVHQSAKSIMSNSTKFNVQLLMSKVNNLKSSDQTSTTNIVNGTMAKSNEFMLKSAIDELRRQNERMFGELSTTQDLLENYRSLVKEHIDACICSGRDHCMSRWRRYESDYKRLIATRLNESSFDGSSFGSTTPFFNSSQEISISTSNMDSSSAGSILNRLRMKKFNSINKGNEVSLQPVNESNSKSKIQSYLDKINPVKCDRKFVGSVITNSPNVIIRKRSITGFDNKIDQSFDSKKLKILKVTPRESNDHEVERLDQLNNALDQILLGRYDALSQIQTRIFDNYGDEEEEDDDEEEEEDNDEEDEEERFQSRKSNGTQEQADEDQDDEEDDDDADDDIIFLDEVKSDKMNSESQANSSTILSAALESGYKPYPTYHPISVSINPTSSVNISSKPSTQPMVLSTSNVKVFQSNPSDMNICTDENQNTILLNDSKSNLIMQKRPHLTNEERLDIINRLKMNESGATLAREYGITKQAVSAIKRRAQMMGDNFQNINNNQKFFVCVSSSNSSTANGQIVSATKHSLITGPNGQKKLIKEDTSSSPITINLSPSSVIDNSLVTRQLKQQKFNATLMKQSNLLAAFPRAASNLVLPVNPVAIIKSQMAKQKQQQHLKQANQKALESSPIQGSKIDSKRLLLPRLLQGTETYPPVSYQVKVKETLKKESDKMPTIKQSEVNDDGKRFAKKESPPISTCSGSDSSSSNSPFNPNNDTVGSALDGDFDNEDNFKNIKTEDSGDVVYNLNEEVDNLDCIDQQVEANNHETSELFTEQNEINTQREDEHYDEPTGNQIEKTDSDQAMFTSD